MSILNGLDAIIDAWLGIQGNPDYGIAGNPAYFSKEAAIDLSENGGPLAQPDATPVALVAALLDQIHENWTEAGLREGSCMNWLLRKNSELGDGNYSAEVILERLVLTTVENGGAGRLNVVALGC